MSRGLRVLLIDDDDAIRRVGQLSLCRVGRFDVLLAASGQEGVELALRERPDVILLDVMMPGMDGPTTLARLRDDPATAEIPVIFVTAKVQRHEVERYLALGATAVITKPFDPMTLPAEVLRALDRSAPRA